jgi:HEAT repeat protein
MIMDALPLATLAGADLVVWRDLLVDGLVKGTLLLAIAGLGAYGLRRASAAARHLVWSLGLASLLLLPVASWLLPAWRLPLPRRAVPALSANLGEQPAAPTVDRPAPALSGSLVARSAAGPGLPTHEATHSRGALWLVAGWLAGTLLILARFGAGFLRLGWIARRSPPVTGGGSALARGLACQLGVGRPVAVLESRDAAMPVTWGVRRPVVLLPIGCEGWPLERLRVVLSHELVHVLRGDCAVQMLTQLVCALYWFNPLVWFAARRLRMERERACDDRVLGLGVRPADYASHLLAIARSLAEAPAGSFAAVAMARRSQLEERLLAILDGARNRGSHSRLASVLGLAVAVGFVGPLAAVRLDSGSAGAAAKAGVERLISNLKSPDWQVRRDAAQKLARAGTVAAVEPLIAALQDERWEVRKYAAFALVQVGDRRAVEPLIQALDDSQWDVREQAAIALGRIGDPRAAGAVQKRLADPDWHVREQAAIALRNLETSTSQPVSSAAALLKDPDWRVRQQAVISLGQGARSADSLDLLAATLRDDESWHVREVTAAMLGRRRDARAFEPLLAALKDADFHVRGQAAFALGLLGDHRAVEPLRALLTDAVADVRDDARKALARLGD